MQPAKSSQLSSALRVKENKMASNRVQNIKRSTALSLDAEDLDYSMTPDLSLVASRTQINNYSQAAQGTPNCQSIFILNSGSAYINPRNCYLSFKVKLTSSGEAKFNSAIDLIERLVIRSRTGEELEHIDSVNLLFNQYNHHKYQRSFIETVGSGFGMVSDPTKANIDANTIPTNGEEHFTIPMYCISGLFAYEKLIPSHLCSGMRIEVTWTTAARAFYSGSVTNYVVDCPVIVTDSYKLNNLANKFLNEASSVNGLDVEYSTFFAQHNATVGGTISVEVRRAVSKALKAIAVVRPGGTEATTNSFVSEPGANITELQWRLGAHYYPSQKATVNKEIYYHTLLGMGKFLQYDSPGNVSYAAWSTDTGGGLGSVVVDLERSTKVELAAIPINNSRVLAINMKMSGSGASRTTDVFLHYIKIAKCYLDNCVVSE